MKKLLIATFVSLCLFEYGVKPDFDATMYIALGRYYTSGKVVTLDGNIWNYSQDIISETPSYNNEPVYVLIYDSKTPGYIYDDEIVGVIKRDEYKISSPSIN